MEVDKIVVLNNFKKRNVIASQFASVTTLLMQQSTPEFLSLAQELENLLATKFEERKSRRSKKVRDFGEVDARDPEGDDTQYEPQDPDAVIAAAIADDDHILWTRTLSKVGTSTILSMRAVSMLRRRRQQQLQWQRRTLTSTLA